MRCVRCEFENIPGQARCIRCGSVLQAGDVAVEVHPPRMPAWQKPLRGTLRWLREHHLLSERLPGRGVARGNARILGWILSDSVAGLLLSVVPGLAHSINGRFAEVRLYVTLWLLCLTLGLFLYGSTVGSVLIGLAIGLHAWIAVQYGMFRDVVSVAARIGTVLAVVAALIALYWVTPRVVAPGISGGYTSLTIPALNVRAGDYLVTRRTGHTDRLLPRGTLVLFHPPGFTNARPDVWRNPHGTMIGQIAGLPGETIRVAGGAYAIEERQLDPERFPVPQWLQRYEVSFGTPIPPGSYFVSTEYRGNARPESAIVRQACLVSSSEIQGCAFLRWWPLTRRGFIE